jgi:hypothetical protein
MVNGYISFLKLVISCSQNRELIFCKNNEAIPRKGERLVLKSQPRPQGLLRTWRVKNEKTLVKAVLNSVVIGLYI